MAKTVRKSSGVKPRPRRRHHRTIFDGQAPQEFKQLELNADGPFPDIAGALNDGWTIYHEWPVYGSIQAAGQLILLCRDKERA